MTPPETRPLYEETLRALPVWIGRSLVCAGTAGAIVILASASAPLSDPLFWLATAPGAAAAILSPLALAAWRLEIRLESARLVVRLHPFPRREVALSSIVSSEPRTYHPFREFLGWGWRIGPSGRALTVPGHTGLQLVLRGGQRLLVSSAHPERLAEAIRSARGQHS